MEGDRLADWLVRRAISSSEKYWFENFPWNSLGCAMLMYLLFYLNE